MIFLANVDDEVNCKDSTGAATGLPDMGAIVTGFGLGLIEGLTSVRQGPEAGHTRDQLFIGIGGHVHSFMRINR